MWKERKGRQATYNNLIRIFEGARNQQCADFIRHSLTFGKSLASIPYACKPSLHLPVLHGALKTAWVIEKGPGDQANDHLTIYTYYYFFIMQQRLS